MLDYELSNESEEPNPEWAFEVMDKVMGTAELSDMIIDEWICAECPGPVELDDALQQAAFCDLVTKMQTTFQLGDSTWARCWRNLQFADYLRTVNSMHDIPANYRPSIQHLLIVHPLDLNNQFDYGLHRPLIQQTTTRFTSLRTLVNDFNFPTHTLLNFFGHANHIQFFVGELTRWLGDVRALQGNNRQLSVLLTDQMVARDDRTAEINVVGQANNVVAQQMVNNMGQIYRIVFPHDILDFTDPAEEQPFRAALRRWILDIRALQPTNVTLQRSVVLTDATYEVDEEAAEMNVMGQASLQVAQMMMMNALGRVYRIA
ncbi:hypothetical protein B0A55_10828 [Friedmanniomyces simplex]|uniref:Uncharacterized protein n=1 Tax=Friedmanniomyces simplex TaxID=329884 RepID=A0A4U0X5J7_9PEZI|nr:hypothetical protein B0A55_10828 [Friedmanniomyces simplex]